VKAVAEPTGGPAEPYVEATFESLYADEVDAMARLAFLMVPRPTTSSATTSGSPPPLLFP